MLDEGPPTGRSAEMDSPENGESLSENSLADDIGTLIDDGKVYAEAEVAFQKSRLSFAANRGKSGAMYAVFAVAAVHLSLIGLVVGSILALTPVITAWGATAVVVGAFLFVGIIVGMLARNRFVSLTKAYADAGNANESNQ